MANTIKTAKLRYKDGTVSEAMNLSVNATNVIMEDGQTTAQDNFNAFDVKLNNLDSNKVGVNGLSFTWDPNTKELKLLYSSDGYVTQELANVTLT